MQPVRSRIRSALAGITCTAAVAAAMPAAAAEFTLFLYETPADFALRTDATAKGQAYWAAYGAYAKALQDAGVIRGGAPLQPGASARTLVVKDGKPVVSTGAHSRNGLELGGYFKIDAPSLDVALEWAAQAPAAKTGAIEVRPGFPAPGM